MKRTTIALATVAALFASTAAFTLQDRWVQQVRNQLRAAAQAYEREGYEMTHRIYTGQLDDGESERVALTLDVGREYQIIGACDNDCTDLDMVLFDGRGRELDSDLLEDDVPIVATGVSRSGQFTVEVRMANCNVEPCRYGIGAFGR
ncbi:MAG TPA: hypothetical protein VFX98_02380 [Longimicrobiaceae bacterium]|nr:hypothetical protein [Longimicrobiaceae bacterium]